MKLLPGRRTQVALAVGVGVLLVAGAVFAASAVLAAPTTPTPSILSGPSAPTTSRSATFSYSDSAAGASFTCSLDGARFTFCPSSGITYSNLSEGSHTFQVEAQAPKMSVSASASRTWSVDTTPPVVHVTFPAANGSYNGTGWNAGCSSPGLCGSASDGTGVASVQVAVFQQSSGKYWNGSSFSSSSISFQTASGTTSWKYPLAFSALSDGVYTLSARASDTLGNATPSGGVLTETFSIDTVAPPAPVITGQPDNPSTQSHVEFHFTDTALNVTFQCQLDSGSTTACTGDQDGDGDLFVGVSCILTGCSAGEAEYENIQPGNHCFQVVAVDKAGNVSPPATFCWTIVISNSFGISGNASGLFYPGAAPQPLNLVLTNPFSFDIQVTAVTITVSAGTTKGGNPNPGCNGTQNLSVVRPFNGTVTVPKKSTKSLSQLGTPASQWPLLQMPDLPVNQDACQNTTFNMSYTGTAVKP